MISTAPLEMKGALEPFLAWRNLDHRCEQYAVTQTSSGGGNGLAFCTVALQYTELPIAAMVIPGLVFMLARHLGKEMQALDLNFNKQRLHIYWVM